jgi:hypothetical protein
MDGVALRQRPAARDEAAPSLPTEADVLAGIATAVERSPLRSAP